MNPLVPLWVSGRVGLFILGLEDADDLAVDVLGKVAARATLRYHAGVHALPDGGADALDDDFELGLGHVARFRPGEPLGRDGAHTLGRLEDRVVYLEPLVLLARLLVAAALELAGDLVGPALQPRIDGLEIDARVAAHPPPVAAARRPGARQLGARHARMRARLRDGREAGRCGRLERGVAIGQRVIVV